MKSAKSDSPGARNSRAACQPLRKTRFGRSVLFHVKRNILHSTQIIHFLLHDHTTPRCENKNLGFLAAFFAIADSFPLSAKRKGTAPQLICCDSGPQFAPLRPVTIRNRKKVAVRTQRIFICAVLIAGDTLNQKGWTIHRPAF